MKKRKILFFICLSLIIGSACKTIRPVVKDKQLELRALITNNDLFHENFSGIYIEGLEDGEIIYEQFSNHRFIPASNIKIFMLYAALNKLDQKIPAFQYLSQRDTLWIWGTGDPGFLYDKLAPDSTFSSFLTLRKEKTICFSDANFMDDRFGAGWAWDDYIYSFQVEKTAFPIYGNRLLLQNKTGNHLNIFPSYFEKNIQFDPEMKGESVTRMEENNQFTTGEIFRKKNIYITRPFKNQLGLIARLLSDTLNRSIQTDHKRRPIPKNSITVERPLPDELYQQMMQQSDNFVAEQLLLTIGGKMTDTLNTRQTIQRLETSLFREIADDIRWVDGSGLSRYNLLTPRSIAWVLKKLPQQIDTERLLTLFPAGGQSGSLKNWYNEKGRPYVFAKTGSMSGVFCLSGYLKNKKGRLLIFSFMHNNFLGSSKKYKEAMTPVLEWLYEN